MAKHRHAVRRDLVLAGYPGDTPIDFGDFISIVLASPPVSAVRYAVEGGFSQTDHLLANLGEQYAGIRNLPQPYARPGMRHEETLGPTAPGTTIRMKVQTVDELRRQRERHLARGEDELKAHETRYEKTKGQVNLVV